MINRYETKEMKGIWSDKNKYENWLKVELAVLRAYRAKGVVPEHDYKLIEKSASIDPERISAIEKETRHDVIAFIKQISEQLGPEKKWFHYRLTSTDIVDTANALLLKGANILIEKELWRLINILKSKALQYKYTPCIGRTHGIHAEITSFGLKWALWYDEALRNLKRFRQARLEIERGKISGAVGNFANIEPDIEKMACLDLGLDYARISTQVISRDFYINYIHVLTLTASFLEKIAMEIRHLSRTEIHELEEYFDIKQKGSSAMPHKRNPIASENICGLSRIMRGFLLSEYENNPLWHERDISHSSAERIILPDATTLLHYMLRRYATVLEELVVFPERMKKNIGLTNNIIFSGRFVALLTEKGLSHEKSYDIIQELTFKAHRDNIDFKNILAHSIAADYLSTSEIEAGFTYEYYFRNIDSIYERLHLEEKHG